ncbi:hypothetical protein L6452_17643 [Arctium lappa]|uniref:Uncharacterized protein n=1 Tax=Arctium lappa TaxID=4217 RepID=A0ACB9C491_ARCLA|nr:hypothetical protein L6452_17643 [Arctium lappa]
MLYNFCKSLIFCLKYDSRPKPSLPLHLHSSTHTSRIAAVRPACRPTIQTENRSTPSLHNLRSSSISPPSTYSQKLDHPEPSIIPVFASKDINFCEEKKRKLVYGEAVFFRSQTYSRDQRYNDGFRSTATTTYHLSSAAITNIMTYY